MLVTVELAGFGWGLFEVLTVVFTGLNSSQLPLGGAIGPGPNIGRDIITGVVAVSILEIVWDCIGWTEIAAHEYSIVDN